MKKVDTLIHARWVVPVVPEDVAYENYSLVIYNSKIVDLLPTEQAVLQYQANETENLRQHVLIPGLINSHTHAAMSLMRGIADDRPLHEWLEQHIWPLEKKWVSEEFVSDGTDLAIAEMLRGGTTCFNDMYFFPEIVARQAKKHGIRANIGLILIEFPTAWAQNSDEYLAKGLALYEALKDEPLINTPLAPHAPYTVSDESLRKIAHYAEQLNLPIHIHLHETEIEVKQQLQQTRQTPLQRFEQLGLLSPRLIAVHMTQLSDEEITLFANYGGHIVHCPESNLKLGSGFCPVNACLKAGINVALGTDGAASNNDLDMLGEMRTAALLGKGVAKNASAVNAMTALKMATINGAKALGLEAICGSLEVGKSADAVAIAMNELETLPLYNPISQLVYATSRHQITDVWVAGKQLLKQRRLTTFDETELKAKAEHWQQKLAVFS